MDRRHLLIATMAGLSGCAAPRGNPVKLRVKVFPGAQNLPLYAALKQGYFAAQGLDVDLRFTLNSVELRDDLASGAVEIVHTAVDNAVAMRETAGHDVVIWMGGDNSLNELFVQPDIASVADLRGQTLIVDAPDTAYALQAKKILRDQGLGPNDYRLKLVGGTFARVKAMQEDHGNTASMLNPPFSIQARASGLKSLGSVAELLGPYQASGAFSMRTWAQSNGDVVERYIVAYVRALRWSLMPANRQASVDMLMERLTLTRPIAEATYVALVDPRNGLAVDARFDAAGFEAVLALRSEIEVTKQALRAERYVDLSWYRRAMQRI